MSINMKGLPFCCAAFERDYYIRDEMGPNIRIVKALEFEKYKNEIKEKGVLKFFITTGYINLTFNGSIGVHQINFCPYCSTNLHEFYAEEKYVNEIVNEEFIKNISIKRF